MSIEFKESGDNFRHISLSGRLDSVGSDEISIQFAALTGSAERRVVVDLSAVSFLSSIGIRLIVQNAKALQSRGGRMVLFVGANDQVGKTLDSTGICAMIPMFTDMAAADQAALA